LTVLTQRCLQRELDGQRTLAAERERRENGDRLCGFELPDDSGNRPRFRPGNPGTKRVKTGRRRQTLLLFIGYFLQSVPFTQDRSPRLRRFGNSPRPCSARLCCPALMALTSGVQRWSGRLRPELRPSWPAVGALVLWHAQGDFVGIRTHISAGAAFDMCVLLYARCRRELCWNLLTRSPAFREYRVRRRGQSVDRLVVWRRGSANRQPCAC
jgi:hypothetical protein